MGGMDAVTIPLHTGSGRAVAELGVIEASGRHGTVRALLDTGGGALLVTQAVVDRLGLAAGHEVEAGGGTLTSVEPPALRVGDLELDTDGIPAYAVGEGTATGVEGEGVEVVVPAGVLRRHAVVLDYPAGSLTVGAPGTVEPRGVALPLTVHPDTGLASVEVVVAGERMSMLLDSGPPCTLVADRVFRRWLERHPDWPTSAASVGPANMAGIPFEASAPMVRVPEVRWGDFTVPHVAVAWRHDGAFGALGPGVTEPVEGALGGNVLRHFRLALDHAEGLVRLEQGRSFVGHDADMAGIVVGLDHDAGGYRVLGTITGLDDVVLDDRLVAIDGEPVVGLTLSEVVDRLRGTPAETVHRLVLERDGVQVEADAPVLRVV